ncbi:MAG: HypC/HybG/HupF family hydrogenase formation chaperone [Bacteroidota bacterium]|nr:HypC/HybG/HupF family hydrogenase formation chaperone [Bacteroidota bacterium]
MLVGRVNIDGVEKEVAFCYLPDVKVGDYVDVHTGFAMSKVEKNNTAAVHPTPAVAVVPRLSLSCERR